MAILEENLLTREEASLVDGVPLRCISMEVPLEYRVLDKVAPGRVKDLPSLSKSGFRLAVWGGVSVGTWLDLKIKLSQESKPVQAKGIVAAVAPSFSSNLTMCLVAFEDLRHTPGGKALISFMADKYSQLAFKSVSSLVCHPAESLEELKAAWGLAYKEYLARGYCEPHPSQMYYTYFCFLLDTRTFVLKKEDRVIGTMTLVADSPCGLPMESLFPSQIAKLRRLKRRLAEVSLLALDLETVGKGRFALTNLQKQACFFRLAKTMSEYGWRMKGITDLIFGVHPKHEPLYQYMTGERIGPARSYKGARGNPALPMRINIQRGFETPPSGNSFWSYIISNPTPEALLQKQFPWTPERVREFLITSRPLWEKLSPTVQVHLKSCYPGLVALTT